MSAKKDDNSSKDKNKKNIEKLPLDYILNGNKGIKNEDTSNKNKSEYDISIEDDEITEDEITLENIIKKEKIISKENDKDETQIPSDTVQSVSEASKQVEFQKKYNKKGKKSKSNKEIIVIGLKLMSIALVMTLILSVINQITFKKINAQTQFEKSQAMQKIFMDAQFEEIEIEQYNFDSNIKAVYMAKLPDEEVGYCVSLATNGFGGPIELIVGVNENKKIEGISVISHAETPNIGTKPLSDSFLSKFVGAIFPVEFTKTNQGINAISGATITSTAIKKGVNDALSVIDKIKGEESVG